VPLQTATAPQQQILVEHLPSVSKSVGDPETGSNTSKMVAGEVPLPRGDESPSESSYSEKRGLPGRSAGRQEGPVLIDSI
jgi:hypothetical protein